MVMFGCIDLNVQLFADFLLGVNCETVVKNLPIASQATATSIMYSYRTLSFAAALLLCKYVTAEIAQCGPPGQKISMAGSSTVYPLAQLWAEKYMTMCDGITITVEKGGSSSGAARVCGNLKEGESAIDIGDMSREWYPEEGQQSPNGYLHQCVAGDQARSNIQIGVAVDGISLATKKNGTADNCIHLLGGLSVDQLRWIYSNYTFDELLATGWDPEAITNDDADPKTHLWSEIDSRCDSVEVRIAGTEVDSGTSDYFQETVLVDLDYGENYASTRFQGYYTSTDDDEILQFLETNDAAIAFVGSTHILRNKTHLSAVPIENDEGNYILPTIDHLSDGTYNPFSRVLYMNLLNDAASLDNTRPFINFGFSSNGTDLVAETGYAALGESERQILLSLLPEQGESIVLTPFSQKNGIGSSSSTYSSSGEWQTSDSYLDIHGNTFCNIVFVAINTVLLL